MAIHDKDVLTERAAQIRYPHIEYQAERHSACRTDEYIFAQLIPYIGNKRKLLALIARGIEHSGVTNGTFVDLFTGSTVVARLAKTMGFQVVANDWEPYSYAIAQGTVSINHVPLFARLGGFATVFQQLNALPPVHGYIAQHFCPRDDEHPNLAYERMFFTRENGERIDALCERIDQWASADLLLAEEKAYLLSALVYAVSYVSNTSGIFKGFHHGWGGKTSTALYRIRSVIQMVPPLVCDNGRHNWARQEDAQVVGEGLVALLGQRADIAYIDPPYNQHPYSSNYHLLNTIVLWDKPSLHPTILTNGKHCDKSAIRKDWRDRRSAYNRQCEALPTFQRLIATVEARWVMVSYSTDGFMPLEGLLQAMADYGTLTVFTKKYKRYRVSTPRMPEKPHTIEFLAVLDKDGRSSRKQVAEMAAMIRHEDQR